MRGIKLTYPDGCKEYLQAHYAHMKNADILVAIGLPPSADRSLRRLASTMGLKKSPEFMAACQREAALAAAFENRGTGNAGRRNLALGAKYQFKPGETCAQRLGVEGERKRVAKAQATRNETIRKDRMRIRWGLPQHSHLKLVSEGRKTTMLRYNLKRHGYGIPARGSKIILITNNTRRSALMEKRAAALGLKFYPS